MSSHTSVLFYGPGCKDLPGPVSRFVGENGLEALVMDTAADVMNLLNRAFPACVVFSDGNDPEEILVLTRRVKDDAFTGIVPLVVVASAEGPTPTADYLSAGADEVITDRLSEREAALRLDQVIKRADRDVSVHPTTRLGGTVQIHRDMAQRLAAGQEFAVCYADLDHFKEFNDRYGYANGDRVILLLSRIQRDIVRALAPGGFVGHIGGDDFIFVVPLEYMERVCDEIIGLFDELIPYQYTQEDRKAGYFLGKDRRGNVHRIPLMTLSIGVVTNQFQEFTHTGQISELAAEMKTYAKTLPGSVYVVDRRHQQTTLETAAADAAAFLEDVGTQPAESNP